MSPWKTKNRIPIEAEASGSLCKRFDFCLLPSEPSLLLTAQLQVTPEAGKRGPCKRLLPKPNAFLLHYDSAKVAGWAECPAETHPKSHLPQEV